MISPHHSHPTNGVRPSGTNFMFSVLPMVAAAFIASEGGEELRLYQTTAQLSEIVPG